MLFLKNRTGLNKIAIKVLYCLIILLYTSAESVFGEVDKSNISMLRDNNSKKESVIGEHESLTDFRAYKSNYILPVTFIDSYSDRQEKEVKFQISFKQELFAINRFHLFLGYTQKSLWQAYDGENSRPFRETNYNPELFVESPEFLNEFGQTSLIMGLEHESNGMVEPYSRSWNRIYVKMNHLISRFSIELKSWYRLPESEKKYPLDPTGDENPYIFDYYGFNELAIRFNISKLMIKTFGRYNPGEKNGAVQIDIAYPILNRQMSWYCQYWNGYGESLIDYDKSFTKIGLGLMFTK